MEKFNKIKRNQMHSFIGFLRLYQSNNFTIVLTIENYKIKYAILDSNDQEVTYIQGVDWYDLKDVMETLQILEYDLTEGGE